MSTTDPQRVIQYLGIPEYDQQTRRRLRQTRDTGQLHDDFISAMTQRSRQIVRQSEPNKKRVMVLGGMNRPTQLENAFRFNYEVGRPSYYNFPDYDQAFVFNMPVNHYKRSSIIPLLHLENGFPIKGFFGDFNKIEDWEVFPDNFFDLIVMDFSTSKFFDYNPDVVSVITKKLKPRGSFYLENLHVMSTGGLDPKPSIRQTRDGSFMVQHTQSIPFQRTTPHNYGMKQRGRHYYRISKKTPLNEYLRSIRDTTPKEEIPLQDTQTLAQIQQKIKQFSKSGSLIDMYYFLRKLPEYRTNPQKTFFQTQKQIKDQDIIKHLHKKLENRKKIFERTRFPRLRQQIQTLTQLLSKLQE